MSQTILEKLQLKNEKNILIQGFLLQLKNNLVNFLSLRISLHCYVPEKLTLLWSLPLAKTS